MIGLDALAVERTLTVGDVPERVVFTADGRFAFVNDTRGRDVTVIDAGKLEVFDRIAVEASGWHQGMVFGPDGSRLYAVNHGAGSVSVLDSTSPQLLKRLAVGDGPSNIVVTG